MSLENCYKIIHESAGIGSNKHNDKNNNQSDNISYLATFLKQSTFDKIKYRQTKLNHNLFDIIWPAIEKSHKSRKFDDYINCDIVAPDFDVFVVFQEFLIPLIKDMHCLNINQALKPRNRLFYFPIINGQRNEFINYEIDSFNKYVSEVSVECSRNLDNFELPINLNISQIEHVERVLLEKILTTEFGKVIGEQEAGTYYTMSEILGKSSDIKNIINSSNLMMSIYNECFALNDSIWPYGRGVFISHKGDLAAWINVQDHLRLTASTPKKQLTNAGYAYSKVGRAVAYLENKLQFRENYFLGYLSSKPSFLGTSLKISTVLTLPNLMKEIENLRHLCIVRGLRMLPMNEKKFHCRVINMRSLGCTEWRLFQDYCTAISNIVKLEDDMNFTNSKQIAATLVKIFRRKKNIICNT